MDTLDTAEAARLLHINVKRVQSLARSGALPSIRLGKRWLFRRAELERLLAAHAWPPDDPLASPFPPIGEGDHPVGAGPARLRGSELDRAAAIRTSPANDAERPRIPLLETSARNLLRGEVESVREDGVMAEVTIRIGEQELVSVITSASAKRLRLTRGATVLAMIKSTEVMIARAAVDSGSEA